MVKSNIVFQKYTIIVENSNKISHFKQKKRLTEKVERRNTKAGKKLKFFGNRCKNAKKETKTISKERTEGI